MTSKQIEKSIAEMRLTNSSNGLLDDLVKCMVPAVFIILLTQNEVDKYLNGEFVSFFSLLGIFLSALFITYSLRTRNLVYFPTRLTKEEFIRANSAAAALNDWKVIYNGGDYFHASKHFLLHSNDYEIVAILRNGKLYLNGNINPFPSASPFSLSQNKKDNLELIKQYREILKGADLVEGVINEKEAREKEFMNESEWTFKTSVRRIFLYLLCVVFILLAILLFADGAIVYGIILLTFAIGYLFLDLRILRIKNRKK